MEQRRKTIYDLQAIVERCFTECIESGYIKEVSGLATGTARPDSDQGYVLVNRMEVAKHIALTIVGELLELELIRRLAPIFREVPRIERDLMYIEDREADYKQSLGLRIPVGEPPKIEGGD